MNDDKSERITAIILVIPIIWFGLLIAPHLSKGLPELIPKLPILLNSPFKISFCSSTLRTVFVCLLIYGLGVGVYFSSKKNYRRRVEYGSAVWGSPQKLDQKYSQKPLDQNVLFSNNVKMGLDTYKHKRCLNILVVGGSGAGKTRSYCKPNLLQCNTSFFILDPKGEILRGSGHVLEAAGYKIKVIDLIDMEKSYCFNPFAYIKNDNDILRLITNLIRNTTPKGSKSEDPFWEKSETALLEAICLYLYHYALPEEQNFSMVMEMLTYAEVREDDELYQSPLDELFERLEMKEPESLAVKQYKIYKQAAGKTAKSILVSVGVRLAAFNLPSLAKMTSADDLNMEKMGEEKTALFAIIPDNDSSFNFTIGMLYTSLFQQLFYSADKVHQGRLPIPVHFLMDEFANVALPDDFPKLLSTMRSRSIFCSIILQNISQLKALYKDEWESIIGNCDEFLYLGGNEQSTHKYVSELLGKESIDTNTYGKTTGHSGSYSTNYQQAGRELLTPDEVRKLDNQYCILFVRGENPVKDLKFNLLKHPNIEKSSDVGYMNYDYSKLNNACQLKDIQVVQDAEYELLSDEEIEKENISK